MNLVLTFFKENIACDIFLAIGLLAIYITYIGAPRASKKSGHYVSGIPGVGGLLIIIGFLTSNVKWLAVIGLFEPAVLYLIFKGIPEIISGFKALRNWTPPKEFEGGESVAVSSYKNRYEEHRGEPIGNGTGYLVHSVVRYIIIKKDDGYQLLGQDLNESITTRADYKTIEECKKAASRKAKWRDLTYDD